MKAYWINTTTREISDVEYEGLQDMQRMVGGDIEAAYLWPSGDVLYVDEKGMLKNPTTFFSIPERADQQLCGNGLLVGREVEGDEYPGGYTILPPAMSIAALRSRVSFRSPEQVRAWAKANSSEPAITFHAPGQPPAVIATMGEVFGAAPPKKPAGARG